MHRLAPIAVLLLAAATGCKHRLAFVPCDEVCHPGQAAVAPPCAEVQSAPEIRVKAPPQKSTVTLPPSVAPEAAPAPPAAAPAPPQQPAYAPPPGYAPGPMSAPYGAPGALITGATQTVSPTKHRITLGLDFFNIPIPYPKFFVMPPEQEVITRHTYQPVPSAMQAPAPVMSYAPPPPPVMMAPAPAPAPAAAPAPQKECAPDCKPECGPLLKHLDHLHNKLDCLKSQLKPCDQ